MRKFNLELERPKEMGVIASYSYSLIVTLYIVITMSRDRYG
jgi:hypothetical protein